MKNFVRGINFGTGFRLTRDGAEVTRLEYTSQTDPRGSIPKWIINLLSTTTAPKSVASLQKVGVLIALR